MSYPCTLFYTIESPRGWGREIYQCKYQSWGERKANITQAVSQRGPIIREQTMFVCQISDQAPGQQPQLININTTSRSSRSSYTNTTHVSLAPNVDVVVVTGEVMVTCTETWGTWHWDWQCQDNCHYYYTTTYYRATSGLINVITSYQANMLVLI